MVNLPPPDARSSRLKMKKEAKAKPPKPNPAAKQAKATTPHQQRAGCNPHQLQSAQSGRGEQRWKGRGCGRRRGRPRHGQGGRAAHRKSRHHARRPSKRLNPNLTLRPSRSLKPAPRPEPAPIARARRRNPNPDRSRSRLRSPSLRPEPAPAPHVPVYTEAAQTYAPQPAIPDDLRGSGSGLYGRRGDRRRRERQPDRCETGPADRQRRTGSSSPWTRRGNGNSNPLCVTASL